MLTLRPVLDLPSSIAAGIISGKYSRFGGAIRIADGHEGARYRNAIGTYLHGSLLPKNPTLTDALIKAGLERRHGREILLAPIDDVVEDAAHDNAVKVAAGRSRRA